MSANLIKLATWNVNSLPVRLEQVLNWISLEKPDILALQELKTDRTDSLIEAFKKNGYYTVCNSQKAYNGVAILSRLSMIPDAIETPDIDEQRRIISVNIQGIRVISVYVPNGDTVGSQKYDYKLEWLKALKQYITQQQVLYPKIIILGDFNIAPSDQDVHDPAQWRGKVLCSDSERQLFQAILALGFADSFRLFPQAEQIYSWWDYRRMAFRRNAGLRIDHIVISNTLKKACFSCMIDQKTRAWERPSDHAPVVACFNLR